MINVVVVALLTVATVTICGRFFGRVEVPIGLVKLSDGPEQGATVRLAKSDAVRKRVPMLAVAIQRGLNINLCQSRSQCLDSSW